MKSWTDGQVFFVFDTQYCQNEEDDPKDAIVYFYPQDTTDVVRCTLCCQLMGMCRFLKNSFAPVTLIRLDKGKFAIKESGKYTVAIKGSLDMPDSVLQRQLSFIMEIFTFYYRSFDSVWDLSNEIRTLFLEKMDHVWSTLLPISQHGGDTLSLTFGIIPALDLPKTAGLLYLQATQFLQACQRFSGVYAGCLFCSEQVLSSQLPMSIMKKLNFIPYKQKSPGEAVLPCFDLPGGVSLITIYLNERETIELHKMNKEAVEMKKLSHQSGIQKELVNDGISTSSSSFEIPVDDNPSSVPPNTEDGAPPPQLSLLDVPHSKAQESETPSYESCVDSPSHITTDPAAIKTASEADEKANFRSSDIPLQQQDGAAVKADVISGEAAASAETEALLSSLSDPSSGVSSEETASGGGGSETEQETVLKPYLLYLQGYNDTVLVEILDVLCTEDPHTLHRLWQLAMDTIVGLEAGVKSCLEMAPKKDAGSDSTYLYLQYDQNWKSTKANLSPSKSTGFDHQLFNRSTQLLHEDFQQNPQLYETTIRTQDHVIYGHKLGSRETYYFQHQQQHYHRYPEANAAAESGIGFPLQSDLMATVASKARRRLEKEQRIVLL